MDGMITAILNAPAGNYPLLDSFMIALTQFGVPIVVIMVALQWWSRKKRTHVRHVAITAGLSFVLGLGINQVILLFMQRVRPYEAGVTHLIIPPSADPSFPSDHATAVIAIVAAFCLQGLPRRTSLLAAAALLIMWSRVYVGTHYVTDVAGGALTGLAAAMLVRELYREGSHLDAIVTGIL